MAAILLVMRGGRWRCVRRVVHRRDADAIRHVWIKTKGFSLQDRSKARETRRRSDERFPKVSQERS